MRPSAFTALVLLAHERAWCWTIHCGTCGHLYYKRGLLELGYGGHPSDNDWWSDRDDGGNDGYPSDRFFTPNVQRHLLRATTDADYQELFGLCGITFTLASIGLLLHHCEKEEMRSRILSPFLTKMFNEMLMKQGGLRNERVKILLTMGHIWNWKDLEQIENELKRP